MQKYLTIATTMHVCNPNTVAPCSNLLVRWRFSKSSHRAAAHHRHKHTSLLHCERARTHRKIEIYISQKLIHIISRSEHLPVCWCGLLIYFLYIFCIISRSSQWLWTNRVNFPLWLLMILLLPWLQRWASRCISFRKKNVGKKRSLHHRQHFIMSNRVATNEFEFS